MSRNKDLKDVTFIIPVRIDSIDRLENLIHVSNYVMTNFDTNVLIHEVSAYNNGILKQLLPNEVELAFSEDMDPVFYRTRIINKMIEEVTTPFVGVWDSDVLVTVNQVLKSIEYLRQKEADFVSPYNGKFMDTSLVLRSMYFKVNDISFLERHKNKMNQLYGPEAFGGGFFADLNVYKEVGLENEAFYGWGHEDGERINRFKIFETRFERVQGVMFHLTHSRGLNSGYQNPFQKEIKLNEIRRTGVMTKEELQKEIASWK